MHEEIQPAKQSIVHELKCWLVPFDLILAGLKPWELRENDRGYRTGDTLVLMEWNALTEDYTGRAVSGDVKFVMHGGNFGLPESHCIMTVDWKLDGA